MASYRLKLRSTEIDLPAGELLIGRGTDCFLRIDDDLVSRRHAKLIVTPIGVQIEDLGSRNGSIVNGTRLVGTQPLKIGDVVEIGQQTFQLLKGIETFRPTVTMLPHMPCPGCQRIVPATTPTCPHCGAALQAPATPVSGPPSFSVNAAERTELRPAVAPAPSPPPATPASSGPTLTGSAAAAASGFQLIAGLVDKLLALGRVEEAERMVAMRLRDLLAQAQVLALSTDGSALPPPVVEGALTRAVRLATATGRDEWYRWVFDFARATHKRIDDKLLDELHANMMAHKPGIAEALMFYFALHDAEDPESVQHRKRLEALLRFCRD